MEKAGPHKKVDPTTAKTVVDESPKPGMESEGDLWTHQFKERDIKLLNLDIILHPTVLLSVIDHYARAAQGTSKRVVGCLLGEQHGSTVHILNAFAVPFEEHPKDKTVWYLDNMYLDKIYWMSRKIHARERVVGWYSTSGTIQNNDNQIHELFRNYCRNPIFLLVDVHAPPEVDKVPVQTYVAFEQPANDETFRRTFVHMNYEIGASEAEEVAVEHLLKDANKEDATTLGSTIAELHTSLKQAASHMRMVSEYLNQVAAGSLPANHVVLGHLQTLVGSLPDTVQLRTLGNSLGSQFLEETNDAMLATFLAFATRLVMAVHALIKNKMRIKTQDSDATSTAITSAVSSPAPTAEAK